MTPETLDASGKQGRSLACGCGGQREVVDPFSCYNYILLGKLLRSCFLLELYSLWKPLFPHFVLCTLLSISGCVFRFSGDHHCHRPPWPWWQLVLESQSGHRITCACVVMSQTYVSRWLNFSSYFSGSSSWLDFSDDPQPPPATLTMVAGGGAIVPYAQMLIRPCITRFRSLSSH